MKNPFQRSKDKKTQPSIQSPKIMVSINSPAKLLEPHLQSAFACSNGIQREYNEDAVLTIEFSVTFQDRQTNAGIYAIADGMGGHQHGEIASKVAVTSLASSLIEQYLLPQFNPSISQHKNSIINILKESVLSAHQEVLQKATGGGTTLTCCLVFAKTLTIAHIGDCRAYYIGENGEIKLHTRDHSLVKRLVELGQISEQEAQHHPQRNVLYRALGQTDPIEVDVFSLPLPPSGYLLLCSDGLWGVISEIQIVQTIKQSTDLQVTCNRLIQLANEAGGPDNISVILVKFSSSTSPE